MDMDRKVRFMVFSYAASTGVWVKEKVAKFIFDHVEVHSYFDTGREVISGLAGIMACISLH